MAGNRMICTTNQIDYSTIRKAMTEGVRTKEELQNTAGVCLQCEGCQNELEGILSSVCGCKRVSLKQVLDAVMEGADTVDMVGERTGAGTGVDPVTGEPCGRCKGLIQNIITLKK